MLLIIYFVIIICLCSNLTKLKFGFNLTDFKENIYTLLYLHILCLPKEYTVNTNIMDNIILTKQFAVQW